MQAHQTKATQKFHIEQLDALQPQYFTLNFRFPKVAIPIQSARFSLSKSVFSRTILKLKTATKTTLKQNKTAV